VHGSEDVIKLLMVGADVTMLCSTLLKNGIGHLAILKEDCWTGWRSTNTNQSIR